MMGVTKTLFGGRTSLRIREAGHLLGHLSTANGC